MSKRKKRRKVKRYYGVIFLSIVVFAVAFIFSFIIFKTDFLKPNIDYLTSSYISFYNYNSTDMLRISNIKRMSDKMGISSLNRGSISFNVDGDVGKEYEIDLYNIGSIIDYECVHYNIVSNNKNVGNDILSNARDNMTIYTGRVRGSEKINLKIWIDKKCKKRYNNVSFEIRVKTI